MELGTANSPSEIFTPELELKVMPQPLGSPNIVAPDQQPGAVERNIAKLLHQSGLADKILKGDDFYLEVENEPFTPLSIKRHGQELYLTHFLPDSSGDLVLDSEMVCTISAQGQLSLCQTAVQDLLQGGEIRRNDRQLGTLFSKNLLDQGFAEAAISAWNSQVQSPVQQDTKYLTETESKATGSNTTIEAAPPTKLQVQSAKEILTKPQWLQSELPRASSGETGNALIGEETVKSDDRLPAKKTVGSPQSSRTKRLDEPGPSPESKTVQLSLFDLGTNLAQDAIAPYNLNPIPQTAHPEAITKPLIEHPTLSDKKTESAVVSASFVVPESPQVSELILPIDEKQNWSSVRQSLVTQGLPVILIDRLHERGLIYADSESNAVFLHHSVGNDWQRDGLTGATLVNTTGKGQEVSHNSSQDGWFWFSAGSGELSRAVLTSSAVDALTCAVADRRDRQGEGISVSVYLSVAGSDAVPNLALKALLERGDRVEVAFRADWASEQMARSILKKIPGAARTFPTQVSKDAVVEKASQSYVLPQSNPKMVAPMQILQQIVDQVDKQMGDFLASSGHSSPSLDTLRQCVEFRRN